MQRRAQATKSLASAMATASSVCGLPRAIAGPEQCQIALAADCRHARRRLPAHTHQASERRRQQSRPPRAQPTQLLLARRAGGLPPLGWRTEQTRLILAAAGPSGRPASGPRARSQRWRASPSEQDNCLGASTHEHTTCLSQLCLSLGCFHPSDRACDGAEWITNGAQLPESGFPGLPGAS